MKRLLLTAAAIAAAIAAPDHAHAQGVVGTFTKNAVEKTGQPDAVSSPWLTEALSAIPADDSGKWQVLVFTSPKCPDCDRLKADFAANPALKALASEDGKGWAHLTAYSMASKSQHFRFQDWDVAQTPVVCVTPPPNSRIWPYYEVARRTGYKTKPDELARELVDAIGAYARRFGPQIPAAEQTPVTPQRDHRPRPDQGQDDPPPAPPPPRPKPNIVPGPNILPDFPPILRPDKKPEPKKTAAPKKQPESKPAAHAPRLDLLLVIKDPTSLTERIEARHVIKRVAELTANTKINWNATCLTYKDAPASLQLRSEDLPAVYFLRDGRPIFQMALGTFKNLLIAADQQPPDPAFAALLDTIETKSKTAPPADDPWTINLRGPLTWTWNAAQILAVIGLAYVAILALTKRRPTPTARRPSESAPHGAQTPDA